MRHIGIKDYVALFFNGCLSKALIIIWAISGLILLLIYSEGDTMDFRMNFGKTDKVQGYIKSLDETDVSVNEEEIVKYFYGFSVDGEVFSGQSYGPYYYDADDQVTIEYLISDPENSRIMRMDNSMVGLVPIYIFGFLFLLFSFFLFAAIQVAIKHGNLIENGEITESRRITKEPTNTKINNKTLFKLTYEYEVYGVSYQLVHKTTNTGDSGEMEEIVYKRNKPKVGVFLFKLPKDIAKRIRSRPF